MKVQVRVGEFLPRLSAAVFVNGLSSVSTFLVSLSLSRAIDISGFGEYSLALALYVLLVGGVRSILLEPLLSTEDRSTALGHPFWRVVSLAGIVFMVVFLMAGWVLHTPGLFAVFALGIHGMLMYETWRTSVVAQGRSRSAVWIESLHTGIVVAGYIITQLMHVQPWTLLFVWIVTTAVFGYVVCPAQDGYLRPRLESQPVDGRTLGYFGIDYLAGAGSAQLGNFVLAGSVGRAAVGAVRVGGTLLTPISLVVGAVASLAIPAISDASRAGSREARNRATGLSLIILLTVGFLTIGAVGLGPIVGPLLMGANWKEASGLFGWLCLEAFFSAAAALPFAGHRALLAGAQSVTTRIILGVFRLVSIVVGAHFGGVLGAVQAMCVVSAVSAVTWWISFRNLLRSRGGLG